VRLRTILNPLSSRQIGTSYGKRAPLLSDYVAIPAVETFGTWPVEELINRDMRDGLACYANWMSR